MIARAAIGFCACLVVAIGYGMSQDQARLGVTTGVLIGSGAVLMLAFARLQSRRDARPSWTALVGAVVVGIGVVALVRPAAIFFPRWVLPLDAKASSEGFRVLSDANDPALDAILGNTLQRYSRAYRRLFDDSSFGSRCPVDIVILQHAKNADTLARALGRGGEFGLLHTPVVGRPVIVVPRGAGWGSLAHHWMYVAAPCALGTNVAWLSVGLATLVEKHYLSRPWDDFELAYRSNWRPLDLTGESPPRNLAAELLAADDQTFLRSFFLYLFDEKLLQRLLAKVRAGQDPTAALVEVAGAPLEDIEARWRTWHRDRSMRLPVIEESSPDANAPSL